MRKTRMESASNRSALCQVSLPDFFNNVYKEHLGKSRSPGKIAAGYHILRSGSWLEKQSEELQLGFDYYYPIS